MNRDMRDEEFRSKFIKDGKATWRTYVIGIFVGAAGLLAEHYFPGGSRSIIVGSAAIIMTIIAKRRYWRFAAFWGTLTVLAVLQIPLMMACKGLLDEFKFGFMLLLAVADFFVISLVIEVVADWLDFIIMPDSTGSRHDV